MNLLCIGINHRTAPLEVRESVWFSKDEIEALLPLMKEKYFHECVLISTCNRTEVYGIPKDGSVNSDEVKEHIIRAKNAQQRAQLRHFYALFSLAAVKHIFNVSSGVDSMVMGDIQILSQMKEAFGMAQKVNTVGTLLTRLFNAAFHTGKRTRTETEISDGAVSVSYAAVELANKIFDDLSQRNALLVGAGHTGKLTARHLIGKKIGKLYLTNRTTERAEELANLLGGTVVEFEAMRSVLPRVDIIITSVNAPQYILSADDLHAVLKQRSNKPLFIIDIGVPRNVDPAANKLDNVFLYDIDALNLIVDRNLHKRAAEIPKVQAIVRQELLDFYHWYASLQVAPTIQELRDQFESIRRGEVEKNINRFSSENRELIDLLTKRIVNKILHTPMINLKNGTDGEASEETLNRISTIRSLFGLGTKPDKQRDTLRGDE